MTIPVSCPIIIQKSISIFNKINDNLMKSMYGD